MEIIVRVLPKSSRTEIVARLPDGTWKIKVAAPPDKGKANEALRDFLADHFQVSPSRIRIVAGAAARIKRVRIDTE